MDAASKIKNLNGPSHLVQALRECDREQPNGHSSEHRNSAFAAIRDDLEFRSREWSSMVQLLEQMQQHLGAAERERDQAYVTLSKVIQSVEQSARDLKTAMDEHKDGSPVADMNALFEKNGAALVELEKAATSLSAQFVWCRTVWDQYFTTVEQAKKTRSVLKSEALGRAS